MSMNHGITRPRQFTGTASVANRMEARRLQAIGYQTWVESRRLLEDAGDNLLTVNVATQQGDK